RLRRELPCLSYLPRSFGATPLLVQRDRAFSLPAGQRRRHRPLLRQLLLRPPRLASARGQVVGDDDLLARLEGVDRHDLVAAHRGLQAADAPRDGRDGGPAALAVEEASLGREPADRCDPRAVIGRHRSQIRRISTTVRLCRPRRRPSANATTTTVTTITAPTM